MQLFATCLYIQTRIFNFFLPSCLSVFLSFFLTFSLKVTRAANKIAGFVQRRAYTDAELRKALKSFQQGWSCKDVMNTFGVGKSTLLKQSKILLSIANIKKRKEWTSHKLETAIAMWQPPNKVGPKPHFNGSESALITEKWMHLAGTHFSFLSFYFLQQ